MRSRVCLLKSGGYITREQQLAFSLLSGISRIYEQQLERHLDLMQARAAFDIDALSNLPEHPSFSEGRFGPSRIRIDCFDRNVFAEDDSESSE